jgi:hypothetical protein
VVQDQVDARPRHERRQPPQKLDGVEHDVRRPIAPRLPELQPHLSLVSQVEPLQGHPGLMAAQRGEAYSDVRAALALPEGGEAEAVAIRAYRRWGTPVVLRALPAYAVIHLKGSLLSLFNPGHLGWCVALNLTVPPTTVGRTLQNAGVLAAARQAALAPKTAVVLSLLFALWPVACVALAAVAIWKVRGRPELRLLGTLVVLWMLIVGAAHWDSRFRSPIVPALSVLAAIGLSAVSAAGVSRCGARRASAGAAGRA